MKTKIEIQIEVKSQLEALSVTNLLQNIADNTDAETKHFLSMKIIKNPSYFRNIAEKLKNPIIQKMLG
jgi:hypothetical protein